MWKGINKYTKHHARWLLAKHPNFKPYEVDLKLSPLLDRSITKEEVKEIKRVISESDIIHFSYEDQFLTKKALKLFDPLDKPQVAHVEWAGFHNMSKLNPDIRYTASTAGQLKVNPSLIWIPSMIFPKEKLFRPLIDKPRYPIRFLIGTMYPGIKGEYLLKRYYNIIKNNNTQLVIQHKLPYFEHLVKMRRSHILLAKSFGFPVNPDYGNLIVEAASQGLVIVTIPVWNMKIRNYPPFILITKDIISKLKELRDNVDLIDNIGKKTREWVISTHGEKVVLKKLILVYKLTLEGLSQEEIKSIVDEDSSES